MKHLKAFTNLKDLINYLYFNTPITPHVSYCPTNNNVLYNYPEIEDYLILEYIENPNKGYINTGIIPNNISPILEVKFRRLNTVGTSDYPFGSDGSGNTRFSIGNLTSKRIECRIGNYANTTISDVNSDITASINSIDGKGYVNGTLVYTSGYKNSATNTYPILIFASYNSNTVRTITNNVRVYYLKIWNNTTLVRDFIPCIAPTKEIGMYDLVSGLFFGSENGNAFTAGPVIEESQ